MPPLPGTGKNPDRQRAERAGRRAETLAALLLRLKAYRILARRYRSPMGEIDIVADRFGTLVFVEVKSRRPRASEEEALLAVNRARILRAAQHYLMMHPGLANRPMRFDLVLVTPGRLPRHIRNAFGSDP